MINHSNCDHPSTSSARAKCRRGAKGDTPATPKVVDMRDGTPTGRPKTPRDRENQCDNCGVERVTLRGTDPVDGIMKFVGDKCEYIVRHATDITPVD